jgi:hypothetical protein
MVFSSQIFLFYFLPLVLVGNYALPVRWRNAFITLASYVFYGWCNPWFVGLMLLSTMIDWTAGVLMCAPGASPRRKKAVLLMSMASNLTLLAFFKYFMFAEENVNRLLALFGRETFPCSGPCRRASASTRSSRCPTRSTSTAAGEAREELHRLHLLRRALPHLIAGRSSAIATSPSSSSNARSAASSSARASSSS